jgi:hypothetical protein
MTNKLKKTFFDTFGIEPKLKTFAKKPPIYKYPQITDRILLELICVISKYRREHYDEDYYPNALRMFYTCADNLKDLKEDILDDLIKNIRYMSTKFKTKLKHQVRTLFEEG